MPQDVDPFVKNDTALGQLLEASVNRKSEQAIIVFDREIIDPKLDKEVVNVKFIPAVAFVCIVDYQKADFTNLHICYDLTRQILLLPTVDQS